MKTSSRIFVCFGLAVLTVVVALGCSNDIKPSSKTAYFPLGNGSGDENPAIVIFSLTSFTQSATPAVQWDSIDVRLNGVFLSDYPECTVTDGTIEQFAEAERPVSFSLLENDFKRIRMLLNGSDQFCALDFMLEAGAAFVAKGHTPDGTSVTVETPLFGLLPLAAQGTPMGWESGSETELVLALNRDAIVSQSFLDGATMDETDEYRFDGNNNPGILQLINQSILQSLVLCNDTNSNGEADQNERIAENVEALGDPERRRNGINPDTVFPVPVITMEDATPGEDDCSQMVVKEPLERVFLDGSQSYSPNNNDPLEYWWELFDKPLEAVDAIIIPRDAIYTSPPPRTDSVEGMWTTEDTPKIYLPVAGTYIIGLKVRDARNTESGDPANLETCKEAYLTINVKSASKIYTQLTWDRGDRVDMDLYLVRQRECGTMGISLPFLDRLPVPAAEFPATCTENAECSGLDCTGGACVTSCDNDDYCKQGHPGWQCLNGTCSEPPGNVWECETDADCGPGGFCNPRDVNNCDGDKICTNHAYTATNDSCGFNNPTPDWGVECDPSDNVRLDIDDVDGFGPETISIAEPSPGTYRAVVRLYNFGEFYDISAENPVTAFLSVYISGTPCTPLQMQFSQNTVYWKAVDITWPAPAGDACAAMEVIDLYPANANTAANQCLNTSSADCLFANPFDAVVATHFDPCDTSLPRSIWCDSEDDPDCLENQACCTAE